jgi:peptidyl-tRNA hydrolase, PTH1 family
MKFLYFGLGNPGEKYEHTRHNAGRILLDKIADKQIGVTTTEQKQNKITIRRFMFAGSETMFISPHTFMNDSGGVVKRYRDLEHMLVIVYDDIDLPLGELRLSYNKSGAGHNGMLSVIKQLGTQKIVSLRVGISPRNSLGKIQRPIGQANIQKFVLQNFSFDELKEIDLMVSNAEKIMTLLHSKGLEYTFSTYKS